jgi:hypothetical protein
LTWRQAHEHVCCTNRSAKRHQVQSVLGRLEHKFGRICVPCRSALLPGLPQLAHLIQHKFAHPQPPVALGRAQIQVRPLAALCQAPQPHPDVGGADLASHDGLHHPGALQLQRAVRQQPAPLRIEAACVRTPAAGAQPQQQRGAAASGGAGAARACRCAPLAPAAAASGGSDAAAFAPSGPRHQLRVRKPVGGHQQGVTRGQVHHIAPHLPQGHERRGED